MTRVVESGAWAPFPTLLRGRGPPPARAGKAAPGIKALLAVSALKCLTASCIGQALVLQLIAVIQVCMHPRDKPNMCTYTEHIQSSADAVASRRADLADLGWQARVPQPCSQEALK